jgi:hypothetical protein
MAKKKDPPPEPPKKKESYIVRKLREAAERQEAADDKAHGRRRGQGSSPTLGPTPTNRRATHQAYLVAKNGAHVMYVSCYCTEYDSDHSRGDY